MSFSLRSCNPLTLAGIHRPHDPSPTPAQMAANMHHLIWDMTWYGVMVGAVINFLQVYVVHLGAGSLLVSAITYGPALVSILWQMPAARVINRRGWRMRWVLGGSFIHRLPYLIFAVLPFLTQRWRAELTVLILIVQAVPIVIANTSFMSMMADAVPPERVSYVVSWRMAGYGIASTLATLLSGQILARLPFPLNYQVLFLIGFCAACLSQWHLTRLCVPDRPPEVDADDNLWQDLRQVLHHSRFTRFVVAVGVQQMAIGMITPLLPLFWVHRIGAGDAQISLIVTTYSGATILGSLLTRRAAGRIGRERLLTLATLGFAAYPLLVSLSPSFGWLLPWAALAGLFYGAVSVTLFDNLFAMAPEEDRTNFVAVYNLFIYLSLFLGPLLGGLLAAGAGGVGLGLQAAAVICLISGLMFVCWLRPLSLPQAATGASEQPI